jgi:hypothetical protein
MNRDSIKEIFQTFLITILGAVTIYLLLIIPISYKLGLAFRYDFSSIVILIFTILVICFQIPEFFLKIVFLCLTAAIFTVPVSGLWVSGQSEQYLLGGIIPFSDARYYYMDSRRLLEGALFSTGAARRPLFAALLSSIQWLTSQNLYFTIGILLFIIVIAVYAAVLEIRSSEGVFAGILFFVLTYLYTRFLLGKTLSEMAGLPLGLISFVFLYRGANKFQIKWILSGLFLISLALNARAGALLILPVLIIWAGWIFRDSKRINFRIIVYAVMAVAAGFFINLLMFQNLASSDSMPFGNFSHTLYGLARGGLGWTQIYTDHPETWSMPADIQANYIYSQAFDIIQRKPINLVYGILGSYKTFFSLDDYYGSLCWFGGEGLIGNIARSALYLLIAIGLYKSAQKFQKPSSSLLIAAFLGIFLSIPFAPPLDSNRMRVYAATIPFFVAIPSLGFSFIINKIPWKFKAKQENSIPSLALPFSLAILLVIGMTIVPIFIKMTTPKLQAKTDICPVGLTQISFRVLPGNNIQIVDPGSIEHDWVPKIQKNNFATLVHNLPNWETFPLFTSVKPGQIILADLELSAMKEMILIADWESLDHTSAVQSVCAHSAEDPLLRDYKVYFAEEYPSKN